MRTLIPIEDIALITFDEFDDHAQLHCEIYEFNKSDYFKILNAVEDTLINSNHDVVYTGAVNPDDKMLKCWYRAKFKPVSVVDGLYIAKWER